MLFPKYHFSFVNSYVFQKITLAEAKNLLLQKLKEEFYAQHCARKWVDFNLQIKTAKFKYLDVN